MKQCPVCNTDYPDANKSCPTDGAILVAVSSGEWAPGTVIRGKYRILATLGKGGMGIVYKAQHITLEELRALKVMYPQLAADAKFRQRFLREAREGRKLRGNPHIVTIEDQEQAEDGSLFIAMEYVDGVSVRDLLRAARGPLPLPQAFKIVRGVAEGLQAAHAIGIVHRDIKPDNILMARDSSGRDVAKIVDFGIMALKEASTELSSKMLMTALYAAPEQWRGDPGTKLDGRTDLYSLGMTLYEMLTGRLPFRAETQAQWMHAHLMVEPPPPSRFRPELASHPSLQELVLKLLAKDANYRPADAQAFLRELSLVESQALWEQPAPQPPLATPPIVPLRAPVTPPARPEPALAPPPEKTLPPPAPVPSTVGPTMPLPQSALIERETALLPQPTPATPERRPPSEPPTAAPNLPKPAGMSEEPRRVPHFERVDELQERTAQEEESSTPPLAASQMVQPVLAPRQEKPEVPVAEPTESMPSQATELKGLQQTAPQRPAPMPQVAPAKLSQPFREPHLPPQKEKRRSRRVWTKAGALVLCLFVLYFAFGKYQSWRRSQVALPAGNASENVSKAKRPIPSSEVNDPKAQYERGLAFEEGSGVAVKYSEAARWYRLAADQGFGPAQARLGYLYEFSDGVDADYTEAQRWYRKAADQGNAAGQAGLGHLYLVGIGVPHDYVEALRWTIMAAEAGDPRGQADLGYHYEFGLSAPLDYAEALRWYRKAADSGNPVARIHAGDISLAFAMAYIRDGFDNIQANVEGTVTNAKGQPLPSASITVTNTDTGRLYPSSSATSGYWRVLGVPPGNYTVSAQLGGFETARQTDKRVSLNETSTINFVLQFPSARSSTENSRSADETYKLPIRVGFPARQLSDSPIAGGFLYWILHEGSTFISEPDYRRDAEKWYRTALEQIRPRAEQGEGQAQIAMGWLFEGGRGVTRNPSEAAKWYRKAAERGLVLAQIRLGLLFESGSGVKQDYDQAVRWYRAAAELGSAVAADLIGYLYSEGPSAVRREVDAAAWFRKAAELGDSVGQFNLGVMYATGRGVQKDETRGVTLFRKSAEQGNVLLQIRLSRIFGNGLGVPQDYGEARMWYSLATEVSRCYGAADPGKLISEQQIAEADRRARKWAAEHSSLKLPVAQPRDAKGQFERGLVLETDCRTRTDRDEEAARWYRKSAEQGNADAQLKLSEMYESGKDYSEARKWLIKVAEQRDSRASYSLGFMYATGQGGPKNVAEALKWFGHVADQQERLMAFSRLGGTYEWGRDVPRDNVEAYAWYTLAFEGGDKLEEAAVNRLAKQMSQAQISEAKRRASEWKAQLPRF